MQKQKKPVQEVQKPILTGSWHGHDAVVQGFKMMLSVLFVSVAYLLLCLLMNFQGIVLRALIGVMVVGLAVVYLYNNGMLKGENDASFAEIMYLRNQDGKPISQEDHDRCFHPAKGFFEAAIGVAPFFLIALVFACIAQQNSYTLGSLPAWLKTLTRQDEFGGAVAYYAVTEGISIETILRVAVRAMTMPFVNVALAMGDVATLWAERLAPIWVLIAPLGYALGYRSGLKARAKINTGIAIGDDKKKRRARKERKARQRNAPEQLV